MVLSGKRENGHSWFWADTPVTSVFSGEPDAVGVGYLKYPTGIIFFPRPRADFVLN